MCLKLYNIYVFMTSLDHHIMQCDRRDYKDTLDKAQTDFFKKFLLLPSNTYGYTMRLATGITRLSVKTLMHTWNWIVRFLKMGDNRWPKNSLLNLNKLSKNPRCQF